MLRHVDLCSGIGGFALGFEWAELSRPVLFCDIEEWSRKILRKHWPDVPIAEDVKVLANDPDELVPDCEILTAGYPCQPFSVAGARRGRECWLSEPSVGRVVNGLPGRVDRLRGLGNAIVPQIAQMIGETIKKTPV